jgi:hypothetical protein
MKLSKIMEELQKLQMAIEEDHCQNPAHPKLFYDPDVIINIGRRADNITTTIGKPYQHVLMEGWIGDKQQALANE